MVVNREYGLCHKFWHLAPASASAAVHEYRVGKRSGSLAGGV